MILARDMTPAELAALLHFHADAGVEWLVEDEPVDRVAEFAAERAARNVRAPAAVAMAQAQTVQTTSGRTRPEAPPPVRGP
ncbi:MAG: uracil-DNA glycosylase, partial [Rhizobium sp.]|nr:uracil-DNA glycosylase [Rhizobium sp.]